MPFLSRPHASIYYEISGLENEGPWITLVNGHTRSSRDFKIMSKTLNAEGFRCLVFDNRGSGQSSYEGTLSWEDLVSDVAALWDECSIPKSHLLGISMGGMICQVIAAKFPQRVESLILISTASSVEHLRSFDFAPWGDTLEMVVSRYSKYLTPNFLEKNQPLVKAIAKQTLEAIRSERFVEKAHAQHEAIRGLDNRDLLSKIQAPTLIVHGSDDEVIPKEAGEAIQRSIQGSQFRLIQGTGHLLLAEYGKGLGDVILGWISQHS